MNKKDDPHRCEYKTQTYKTPRIDTAENLDDLGCGDAFLDTQPKTQSMKNSNRQAGLHLN